MVGLLKSYNFKTDLKDTYGIIKNSILFLNKREVSKKPIFNMIFYTFLFYTALFLAITLILFQKYSFIGIYLLILSILFLWPYKFYYNVLQKANQSWIIYNAIKGKKVTFSETKKYVSSERKNLVYVALIDFLLVFLSSQKNDKDGFMKIIVSLFLSFLAEVWDLLSNYMIPAVIIEKKSLKDVIPKIKTFKDHLAATFTGVFALDYLRTLISKLFSFLLFVLIISFALKFKDTTITTELIFENAYRTSLFLFYIYLLFLFSAALNIFIDFLKTTYFTIFYTSIARPMEIKEDIQKDLTNYLFKEDEFKINKKNSKKNYTEKEEEYIKKLSDYVERYFNSGSSEEKIKKYLLSKGFKEKYVDEAIRLTKQKMQ